MDKLTQDIIDELNDELDNKGYCFHFFFDDVYDNGVAKSYLKNFDEHGLSSYIINIDNDVLREITEWFRKKGLEIKWQLRYNSECPSFCLKET